MTVEVRVFGALAARLGATTAFEPLRRRVPVGGGARIREVLAALGIAPDEVSHLFLNGEYSGADRRLRPGDRLGVFGRDMALIYRQYFPRVEDRA